ncbi:glycosyltransferase family 2 protein [Halomonas urumqiensis]|uniref:Glycosyltransferase 2-like domain-containing protein n=1 Tax=Halomonas urumqiensis TaxID=1684789 RepID=A0A2N7UCG4_9GAMM|nr:glycosyltransferase family A protein [Halomonas urumqiensis]PMR78136.1 hypothetical protein C1H70_15280 [Halomonas urumqiensis]PTB03286.1 glycosyltransferase family 2 protein [Halomonas urumqiensis]GHE20553.1 hypothetical protein GCM10017767_10740 [Halomonas urumqiensis]
MISQLPSFLRLGPRKQTLSDTPEPGWFDAEWYLSQYPDVVASGMGAWRHFYMHGRHEGRMPCLAHAKLWGRGELPAAVLAELKASLRTRPSLQANYAAWLLGRWHAVHHEWREVWRYMRHYSTTLRDGTPLFMHRMPVMLAVEAMRMRRQHLRAGRMLGKWEKREGASTESELARANLLHPMYERRKGAKGRWLAQVNRPYVLSGLAPLVFRNELPEERPPSMDALYADIPPGSAQPAPHETVSVIVPAYNASTGLKAAVESVLRQTWPALEVLIVDDASTDDTRAVAQALSLGDERVRVIEQPSNQGAYAARNAGLRESRGDMLTVHDSDDWSHPQKIEQQVLALRAAPHKVACISHWIRASSELTFGSWQTPSGWAGWCHRNTSSLMFRRSVFEQLGYWDRVNCSADTEYFHRIMTAFGRDAVLEVAPGVPLALGRISATSLTQASDTSIFSIFSGMRQQYDQAFNAWHAQAGEASALYLPEHPQARPFPAPQGMLR